MSKKKEIMQNVNNWLEEERYAFGIIYDPQTDLNISISFNEYTGCNVILTKNDSLLLIVTEVTFSEEDKKTFAHLKKESKLVFIQELGYSLSQVNVQYSIYPDSENMDYIQIRYIIYFDGLTNLKPLSNSNDKTGSLNFPFHHFLSHIHMEISYQHNHY
jgi:hypothetical protein